MNANTLLDDHARWQVERIAALTRPDSWLSLIGLFWLDEGCHRVGTAADCEIPLPGGPRILGEVVLENGKACWHPADGGAAIDLQDDSDGTPTVVRHGSLSFFLIARDGRLALRLRDNEAPARRGVAGIESFPYDPAWRLAARWEDGRAHFSVDGQALSLGPQDPAAETLQFVFADATSGKATYGGGRFLFVPRPPGDDLILDFNRAINPPCVFTPYATCPLPAPDNRLPVAVTAGEKTAH